MQMDDDLPVHLNVYISMFKQWWHVKKYKTYPDGFTTESLPLDVMVKSIKGGLIFSFW